MALPTSPDRYKAHLREEFLLHHGGVAHQLTLHDVDVAIENDVQCSFSLLFRGPTVTIPQGNYRVSHQSFGEFDLFLVPIRQRREGILYEAVFNLLKDEAQ